MHGHGDAERFVTGNNAEDSRVDLVHVQRHAVQRAVVGLFVAHFNRRGPGGRGRGRVGVEEADEQTIKSSDWSPARDVTGVHKFNQNRRRQQWWSSRSACRKTDPPVAEHP